MQAKLVDDAILYEDIGLDSKQLRHLPVGTELELGETIEKDQSEWVEASIPDDTGETKWEGYIRGNIRVFVMREVRLAQEKVTLYEAPLTSSDVVAEYKEGQDFAMLDLIGQEDNRWAKVRAADGTEGYLPPGTKLKAGRGSAGAPTLKQELTGWGLGLILMGVLSIALSQYLNPIWGGVLAVIGALVLIVRRRIMFVLIGLCLIAAGLLNLATRGLSPWALFAALQIYLGIRQVLKYRDLASTSDLTSKGLG
jgi:hypothetical protein